MSNPSYAGAYVFGRFKSRKKIGPEGMLGYSIVQLPQNQWEVLIFDHHPGYISWNDYIENKRMLQQNRTNADLSGPAREGAALSQGLILCGRCGLRMVPRYTGNGGISPHYECRRVIKEGKVPTCSRIRCEAVDKTVVDKIMEALQPVQLELAFMALGEVQRQEVDMERNWHLQLERAQYEADRAERQFNLVDPENRLVARSLEARWNEKLAGLDSCKQDLLDYRQTRPAYPSPADKEAILTLAQDLPVLWNNKGISNKDKKRLIRLLIEDITVTSFPRQPQATIGIRWHTGRCDTIVIAKKMPRHIEIKHTPDTILLVERLAKSMTDTQIVQYLNENGFRTPLGRCFIKHSVNWIRFKYQIPGPSCQEGSYSVIEVATCFGVSKGIVYSLLTRGIIKGSKRAPEHPWEIVIDESTTKKLEAYCCEVRNRKISE